MPSKSKPVGTAPETLSSKRKVGVTWRAILLGTLLIPPNVYWITYVEAIWHCGHPTAISLFWNVMFTLLVLTFLNMSVKKVFPRVALTQAELVTVYVMLTMASALAGHDSLQLGIPALTHVTYFATPENKWADTLGKHLPTRLTMPDKNIVKGFYEGRDTLYRPEYIRAWLPRVLWWVSFIIALGTVTICMNIIFRKQWTENERLSFPIIQLPLAITQEGGNTSFFNNKFLWLGIAIGTGIDLLNGFHTLYPTLPYFAVRHDADDFGRYLTMPPWNSMGWTPRPLYPFIIALGYLLPLDLSFSVWFFYLFRKFQSVMLGMFPMPAYPRMPYFPEQSFGAWIVYFAFAAWMARGHLKAVWLRIFNKPGGADDSDEAISYRTAAIAILLGCAYLFIFAVKAGMSPYVVLPFFGIYFLLMAGISRIRAELGPPAHEVANGIDAGTIIANVVGAKVLGPVSIVVFSLMWWFTGRGYRSAISPGQLEGFKMAGEAGSSPRRLGYAMIIGLAVGALATYWASLHLQYQIGMRPGGQVEHAWGQWSIAEDKISNGFGPDRDDYLGVLFVIGGAAFTVFLFLMRHMFLWWPFHPAGYALSMAFGVEYYWLCLVISSLLKFTVLRFGGLRLYRRSLPLAFGVIIGEFAVGAFWSVMSVILRQTTYDFAPG